MGVREEGQQRGEYGTTIKRRANAAIPGRAQRRLRFRLDGLLPNQNAIICRSAVRMNAALCRPASRSHAARDEPSTLFALLSQRLSHGFFLGNGKGPTERWHRARRGVSIPPGESR
jgi:hypothetical protein